MVNTIDLQFRIGTNADFTTDELRMGTFCAQPAKASHKRREISVSIVLISGYFHNIVADILKSYDYTSIPIASCSSNFPP